MAKRRSRKTGQPSRESTLGPAPALHPQSRSSPNRKNQPKAPDPAPQSGEPAPPPIVAIGASAGGLEALREFFAHMPPNSGLAFIMVMHLDPSHKSAMVELLSRVTSMTVAEATEGMAI